MARISEFVPVTPVAIKLQLLPPSVVKTMLPSSHPPIAWSDEGATTSLISPGYGDVCSIQVNPPSVVLATNPVPTT